MKNQDLNIKLAEWVGFTWYNEPCSHTGCSGHCGWRYPNGDKVYPLGMQSLPNFTESLNACIKWLVPKLQDMGIYWELHQGARRYPVAKLFWNKKAFWKFTNLKWVFENGETPAIAFCRAVERLINEN